MNLENININFIEKVKKDKFRWSWKIKSNNKSFFYKDSNIFVDEKNYLNIIPCNELLSKLYVYPSKIKEKLINVDLILRNIDHNEYCFFECIKEIVKIIVDSFYIKHKNKLNKNALTYIPPIDNERLRLYIVNPKNRELETKFLNINTQKKYENINDLLSSKGNIYISPKIKFKSIHILNKCIYINILLKEGMIYKPICNSLHQECIKRIDEKNKIMKLPVEIIIKVVLILVEEDKEEDIDNFILSCKYFFKIYMNNYNILHERWNYSKVCFYSKEWKYQKIKSILNF